MKPHPPASSASKAKPSTKAAPVARKARAAATAATAASAAAPAALAAPAAPADAPPELGQREAMVREVAYYYYEARGFVDGQELEDWLRAEADIERTFASGDSIEPATH